MVEVRVEIMARSLAQELKGRSIQFKARVPLGRGVTRPFNDNSVTLQITQQVYENHKKQYAHSGCGRLEIWLYLEVSHSEGDSKQGKGEELENSSLIGLVRCKLDGQLLNQNLSPSIQWLDIYDPVQNISNGKVLLRIWTTYCDVDGRNTLGFNDVIRNEPKTAAGNVSAMTSAWENAKDCQHMLSQQPKSSTEPDQQTNNEPFDPEVTGEFVHPFHSLSICLSPNQAKLLCRSKSQMEKLGAKAARQEQTLRGFNPSQPCKSPISNSVCPNLKEHSQRQNTEDDPESIDSVIELVNKTMSKVNGRYRTMDAPRLAPERQYASVNRQSSDKTKKVTGIVLQSDTSVLTRRNVTSSTSNSSVNSARSRRIAADIYHDE